MPRRLAGLDAKAPCTNLESRAHVSNGSALSPKNAAKLGDKARPDPDLKSAGKAPTLQLAPERPEITGRLVEFSTCGEDGQAEKCQFCHLGASQVQNRSL
ncbi:MAG: hypothetical protein Devi2KO_27560 [Devosia indica]